MLIQKYNDQFTIHLKMFASIIQTADMTAKFETICHHVKMTQMSITEDLIVISPVLESNSEDIMSGIEAKATFEAAHVARSTAHARRADSDLETDVHDGTTNIHVPTRSYNTCYA